MRAVSKVSGYIAGLISILVWGMFTLFNPYSSVFVGFETALLRGFLLVLPAFLAIRSAMYVSDRGMLIVVIWSFPCSLYFALTPGTFALTGIAWLLYLLSFILLKIQKNRYHSINPI